MIISIGNVGAGASSSRNSAVCQAVAIACEAELQRRSAGAAHQLEMAGIGRQNKMVISQN